LGPRPAKRTLPSDLEGKVIRLPYRFEKIVHLLKDHYLENLKKGQDCEVERQVEHNKMPAKNSS
jgi:hypothetical protein